MNRKKAAKRLEEAVPAEKTEPPAMILRTDFSFSLDMTESGFFVYTFSMTSLFWKLLKAKAEYNHLEEYCLIKGYDCESGEIYAGDECVVPPILKIRVPYFDSSEFENSEVFQRFLSCLKAIKKQGDIVVSRERRASEVNAHYKRISDILDCENDEHTDISQTGA